jgi:1-acyl-sn-glycerol-3-phosphate acyltransferase
MNWRPLTRLYEVTYGAAAWLVMGIFGGLCWLLVVGLPKPAWRWWATWATVHIFSFVLRIPVKVTGVVPEPGQPCVIVANHDSIVDSFALVSVFRQPVVFVAGGDLASHPVTGPFLRGLGAAFVRVEEHMDRSSVRAVLGELAGLARAGNRLVFFPEGGLSPEPGLRRFQLGAFLVAGEVGCPVVPVALLGTRRLLGPGARLPQRSDVEVRLGDALEPPQPGWKEAREVAGRARGSVATLLRP